MNDGSVNKPDTAIDSDMPSTSLDRLTLSARMKKTGLVRLLICSAIGIAVFFGTIHQDGESLIIFSILYNTLVDFFGENVYWIIVAIIGFNYGAHIYYKYIKKGKCTSKFAEVYNSDKVVHTVLYALGFIYALCFTLNANLGIPITEVIVGPATGQNVFPPIVKGVLGIILVGAIFMPFLLNYGALEIIGAILEPIMRPLFKVPGKSALDATSSFVSSSSLGVLITNRLWKQNVYTEKEMVAIMTGFSAVSIGFANLVINTAGVGAHWIKIYGISFIMVFLVEIIMVRIPPVARKKDVYFDGRVQTEEDRKSEVRYSIHTLTNGCSRAVKRAAIARGLRKDITGSLKDGAVVLPQVLTMLSAIGVTAMILAEYTPFFTWLGYIFQPLLSICGVPDASVIAPSMPVGIAEMFLPVLVMNGQGVVVSEAARIFVCLVSMVQIIFFSETATVMLATKSPIKFWEILVCFLERTIIAIPMSALCIHFLF